MQKHINQQFSFVILIFFILLSCDDEVFLLELLLFWEVFLHEFFVILGIQKKYFEEYWKFTFSSIL